MVVLGMWKIFLEFGGKRRIEDKASVIHSKPDCSYVDNACKWCKGGRASECLNLWVSANGRVYWVTAGNCTDTDVVIPGYYEGCP